ncbi:hypothetical protein TrVE_jg3653 [Triparma verrucosa]|uniref:G protein gamma domain-containing protein n=2 Tax=Triparma TaxID=722752 RepID=A0A9W7C265_9STRA|nr:hypothetical protein TrVE_jg3653 [Triparma verrucosa]GMH97882.1 hypothetical protein TrST_g11262 [Triparma strigata]
MSEAQLAKVESELEKLRNELTVCKDADNTSKSCGEIVKYSEADSEPFTSGTDNNPWHASNGKGGGCVIL